MPSPPPGPGPEKKTTNTEETRKHLYENVVDYKTVKEDTEKKQEAQDKEGTKKHAYESVLWKRGKKDATNEPTKTEGGKHVYENVGYKTFKKEKVNESPGSPQLARKPAYNSYSTVSSISTENDYSVYDTMSSTSTGLTGFGSELNLDVSTLDLEQNRRDRDKKKKGFAAFKYPDKLSTELPLNAVWAANRGVTKRSAKKACRKKFPLLEWLPKYNMDWAVSDAIAGITVGLTIIPQGIAYSYIAGLPPQYGLYSSIMGCFAYIFFGSQKDINIGPTAIMALMTKKISHFGPEYVVLLTFLSGIIILVAGLLQLGFLIDFISLPVIAGFTSAAAVTIGSGQWRNLLGIYVDPDDKSHSHAGVVDYYIDLVNNGHTLRWQDALLGILGATIILSLRALNNTGWFKPLGTAEGQDGWVRRQTNRLSPTVLNIVDKIVWFICTSKNAIVVIACLILAMCLDPDIEVCMENRNNCTFSLTGSIQAGLPTFQAPYFSLSPNSTTETEVEEYVSFGKMISSLGISIIILPIIAIVDAVAISKAFAGGKPVDASQEMVALGVANIFGSFVKAMPTTHSLSRAAVNNASGVRTTMGGLYTGGLVILCLAFLMPYCAFIPKASLAAVIMTAILFSVEHHIVKPMWKASKIDLLPGLLSFFVGVFYELEMGVFLGMGIHILIVLFNTARPTVTVEIRKHPDGWAYLSITPDQGIVFPSVSFVRTLISKAGIKQGNSQMPVVIDCEHISKADFTAATGFNSMLEDFHKRDQPVFWLNPGVILARTLRSLAGEKFSVITSLMDITRTREEKKGRRGSRESQKSIPNEEGGGRKKSIQDEEDGGRRQTLHDERGLLPPEESISV